MKRKSTGRKASHIERKSSQSKGAARKSAKHATAKKAVRATGKLSTIRPVRPTKTKLIALPPNSQVLWDKQADYFENHSVEELERAGLVKRLETEDKAFIDRASKTAANRVRNRVQLNLSLSEDDLNRFQSIAKRKHIPTTTLAKSWLLERLDQELR
jgi:hypothetical protein